MLTSQSRLIALKLAVSSKKTVGYLQIDAALVYATGRVITQADYQTVDSPYNTYLYKGLPPGPIANPGMVALNSALNPAKTNYYYYILGNDNTHHFFATHSENNIMDTVSHIGSLLPQGIRKLLIKTQDHFVQNLDR